MHIIDDITMILEGLLNDHDSLFEQDRFSWILLHHFRLRSEKCVNTSDDVWIRFTSLPCGVSSVSRLFHDLCLHFQEDHTQ